MSGTVPSAVPDLEGAIHLVVAQFNETPLSQDMQGNDV